MNSDSKDNPKIGYTKPMIEWRRNKVLHRLCMGWSQAEIAKELQLDPSTISLDVQFLKENAKKELQTHISDRLPNEYNRAVTGINLVLHKTAACGRRYENKDGMPETTNGIIQVCYVLSYRWRRNRASNENG